MSSTPEKNTPERLEKIVDDRLSKLEQRLQGVITSNTEKQLETTAIQAQMSAENLEAKLASLESREQKAVQESKANREMLSKIENKLEQHVGYIDKQHALRVKELEALQRQMEEERERERQEIEAKSVVKVRSPEAQSSSSTFPSSSYRLSAQKSETTESSTQKTVVTVCF